MLVRVGFSQGTTWIGRLICLVTHTDISHSFFLVEDGRESWVYEADPRGFRRVPWNEYQKTNFVKAVIEMEWPHVQVKRMLDEMLGLRYTLLTFFLLGSALLLRRTARRPELLARYGVDCVTSVCRVMRQFGLDILDPVSPAELRQRLSRE